jgi:hypothetical protein
VQLIVEVEMWLVQDGGERELAVGEDWTIDPMFNADAPMQPAEDDSVLEMCKR